MLDKIDLNLKLDKATYKAQMPTMADRLLELQRAAWDAGAPLIIVFEGWDAAGKGSTIQKLAASLDPRGFKLYPIRAPRSHERRRPWMWRFWTKIPPHGEWAIFDRSWYGRVLVERIEQMVPEKEWRQAFRDIAEFERTLSDEGYTLVKFFLHISKTEQKRRFDKLARKPKHAWKVTPEDWLHHQAYAEWLVAYEEAFERTDTEWAPWTIVEATDRRYTRYKVFQTLITALERRLGAAPTPTEPFPSGSIQLVHVPQSQADPSPDARSADDIPAESEMPESTEAERSTEVIQTTAPTDQPESA
ncbi:MAG TPA: hypothetical protein VLS48_06935 [Anaerolineales bacterium]|nr:hypothetical protein [Anaerolineales bacterium]